MPSATILLVDDEPAVLDGLARALRRPDYRIPDRHLDRKALELRCADPVDVIVTNPLMPGMSGLEFLKLVRNRHPDTVRIMFTGHADVDTAVKGISEGEIYRFLSRPCSAAELQVGAHLALEQLELARENRGLLAIVRSRPELTEMLEQARQALLRR